MNESQTRLDKIDPKLKASKWSIEVDSKIITEFPITLGKISQTVKARPKKADYILSYKNVKLAVVEAKADEKDVSEGVMQAKGELYDHLKAHGALTFLNTGNESLIEMASKRELDRIISYGPEQAQVVGNVTDCSPFLSFSWSTSLTALPAHQATYEVKSQLIGTYNIDNMLAAIAVGLYFDVSPEQICHALEHYSPNNNRSQLVRTERNTLIEDAYNANPTSMAAAIDNFERIRVDQPKMVILGDMLELGTASEEEHQRVVDRLKDAVFDRVWLVGAEFARVSIDFPKFENVEKVKEAIEQEQTSGYYILVKGSNGIHLAQLKDVL